MLDVFVVCFCGSKDLNGRAQAEVTIREALRELDLWGAAATFNLTEYTDSSRRTLTLIKDWKDVVNQVDTQTTHTQIQTTQKHGLCRHQNFMQSVQLTYNGRVFRSENKCLSAG